MKKLIATIAVALGLTGAFAAVAPSASAQLPSVHGTFNIDPNQAASGLCVRVNVTVFGNRIGTGATPVCL